MMKTRLVILLAVAALALCNTAAISANTTEYVWTAADWDCSKNAVHPGTPILDKALDWDAQWPVSGLGDPAYTYVLTGDAPDPNDPDVHETVKNYTRTPWTDWHINIVNGTYVPGSAVVFNNNAGSPQWVVEVTNGGKTLFAHVVSGMNTQIDYMETIDVFFSYTVDDGQLPVTISEYPTNYYPIPEPGSIMGLLAGCLTLGFRMRRRA